MANLGQNFYPKLIQISNDLGMKPEDLLAVMTSESGINPSAVENTFKGSGLLGFMPSTLKGLGFKGTWQDFIKLSGEQQLDYVKRLVASNAKLLDGGSFTSAAQYYTANLWPVALKLPGIRKGDANTAFIEAHPKAVKGSDGKIYSKKYYDLGFKIPVKQEQDAYKYNPLFHGSVSGAITFGDMIKQVNKNKQNPAYQKALADMKSATGYQPEIKSPAYKSKTDSPKSHSTIDSFLSSVSDLLDSFMKSASYKDNTNNFLILVSSDGDFSSALEYSRILCLAIKEELNLDTSIHTNNNCIEIQCNMDGNKEHCKKIIEEMSNAIADTFSFATKKIGSVNIYTSTLMDIASDYPLLDIITAETNYDTFHKKFNKEK
jgi:hypothetical protein